MEKLSNTEVGCAKAESVSTGNVSVSLDKISLGLSFWDEISADTPTVYDVRSEIYWKYKLLALPTIVITPPTERPQYSESIDFTDDSYASCCSQLTESTAPSVDTQVPRKRVWKCSPKKRVLELLWRRLRSFFVCCVPMKCGCKGKKRGWLGPLLVHQMAQPH